MSDISTFKNSIASLIKKRMELDRIPGVAFILVKDGKRIISDGYGFSDLENLRPIDNDTTLFRVASISKTFTALATLQLAEQKKLNLYTETNQYLDDLKVKNKFKSPQLVRDLLLHIDGFEEKVLKANALHYSSIPSLKEVFKNQLKPLFIEPGKVITYGNSGMGLASYLVEKLSGIRYENYIESNIFKPLGMSSCIMHQNYSAEELSNIATIYSYKNGTYKPYDISYSVTAGTGGACAVPNEMANFMIALLNNGANNYGSILTPEYMDMVLEPQFIPHENMPGVTYGLFEHFANNNRALIRDGSGFSINSRLVLWPEHNMGFFIVTNNVAAQLCIEATQLCFDHFFPTIDVDIEASKCQYDMSDQLDGDYQTIQYSRAGLSKVLKYFLGSLVVKKDSNQKLSVTCNGYDPFSELQGETHWTPAYPEVFEGNERKGRLCFIKRGKRVNIFSGLFYHSTYEKLKWYEKPRLNKKVFKYYSYIFALLFMFAFICMIKPGSSLKIIPLLTAIGGLSSSIFFYNILKSLTQKGIINGYPSFLYIDAPPRPSLTVLFSLPFINILTLIGSVILLMLNKELASAPINILVTFNCIISITATIFIKFWNLLRLGY